MLYLFGYYFKIYDNNRICKEILEDLPVTYELPSEAHSWVKRMMSYTVDGGKMNRGLSTVSVRKTFAKAIGYQLSIKVHNIYYSINIYHLLKV